MSTDLGRIGARARKNPKEVFTALFHHVWDVDNLRASYEALDRRKAAGIDGVDKESYGKDLEANLKDLSERIRRMGYRPQAKRRTYIPKAGSAKGRPLAISCLEDKIVEMALKRVLEEIYEADFEDNSYGYRRGRTAHQCLEQLGKTIQQQTISYVVEADIRSFFDKVNHAWMIKFLSLRIGDKRILKLIGRMMRCGILEDGLVKASEEGTPQGSIVSPVLSNIYLHYVLDLWFNKRVIRRSRGQAWLYRFADDFVACFQYRSDAEEFHQELSRRMEAFGLKLAEEKTKCLEFGRFARERAGKRGAKPEKFTFLGFDHYCGRTREGYFKVKRRTNGKKLGKSLQNFREWCRKSRSWMKKGEMMRRAKARVQGHLNYYAITDNTRRCGEYIYQAERILFQWLNRKSQRRSYRWAGYRQALKRINWPSNGVRKDLNPCRRTTEAL